ncbi:MAG: Right handed beta helix region, partial [Solirubrobacterales bacterium]|nr:Right handed beta helix region [Solirubrobacterales bacterium]
NASLGELRMVDCRAWEAGSEAARRGTVEDLRQFASGPVGSPAGNGAQLDDDVAYGFLDRYCQRTFAAYFKLYKLYTRAAAFTPQAQG